MTIEYKDSKRIVGLSQLAITHDTTSSTESSGSVSSLTHNMTVADNSNRVLIACVSSYGSAPTITGVTWNGDSMTAVPNSESYQSGSNNRTQIYYIIAPDTGSHSIVASFSGSATCGIGGMSFYNVHQTTPVGAGNTSSATSTATSSLALTPTVTGSWIIAMISSSSSLGSATGLTQSYTEGSNALLRGGRNESPTIGYANTVGWGTSNGSHAMSGCAIIPYGDEKPTDVQDNSILVEKDTARRYWRTGRGADTTSSQTSFNNDSKIENGASQYDFCGQQFLLGHSLIGKSVSSISFWLWNIGSGSTSGATYSFGILDSNGNLKGSVFGTNNVSDITQASSYSGATKRTMTTSTPVTIEANDIIAVRTNQALTSTAYDIEIGSGGNGSIENNARRARGSANNVTEDDNRDVAYEVIQATPATWTMQPTYQTDFSSSTGWVPVGSGVSVTGGKLDANFTTNADNRIYKDLGFDLEDQFIAQFDYYQGTVASGPYWNMFSFNEDSSLTYTSGKQSIGMIIDMGSYALHSRSFNGSAENTTDTGAVSLSANTQFYLTVIRDGTSFKTKVYEDSSRSTQVGSTIESTLSSINQPLRYFHTGYYVGGNSGTAIYNIDNLKVYNGVTSIN